jgi:hypothetical protein
MGGREIRVHFPAGARNLYLLHSVQTGSGAHPASYIIGTRVSFSPEFELPGREADRLSSSNAEAQNEWSCTSTSSLRDD